MRLSLTKLENPLFEEQLHTLFLPPSIREDELSVSNNDAGDDGDHYDVKSNER